MVDYRRFLAATTSADLPYFGGPFVDATDRRLRVAGPAGPAGSPVTPGFWRFEVRGRDAHPVAPADPPDLSALPAVRGYAVAAYLVHQQAERFALPLADQPLTFAPLVGRRWPTGALLFDTLDFESGVEEAVRDQYAKNQTLAGLRGVPAALRAAFAYAVLLRAATALGIPARPVEARGQVAAIAEGGDAAARDVLGALARARERQPAPPIAPHAPTLTEHDLAEQRADAALAAARACLRDTRWLDGDVLEVRYDLEGERFVTLVDGGSLRVVDAGICLDGHDDRLTLESLPGVIRQAIRESRLYITAR